MGECNTIFSAYTLNIHLNSVAITYRFIIENLIITFASIRSMPFFCNNFFLLYFGNKTLKKNTLSSLKMLSPCKGAFEESVDQDHTAQYTAFWVRVHQPFTRTFFVFFCKICNLNITQLLIG